MENVPKQKKYFFVAISPAEKCEFHQVFNESVIMPLSPYISFFQNGLPNLIHDK
jgi:hypothetical protein